MINVCLSVTSGPLLKKKGECIAVQPLDHRTPLHEHELFAGKNITPLKNKALRPLPITLVSHQQETKKHTPRIALQPVDHGPTQPI